MKLQVRYQFPIGGNTAQLEIYGDSSPTSEDFTEMRSIINLFAEQFHRREEAQRAAIAKAERREE